MASSGVYVPLSPELRLPPVSAESATTKIFAREEICVRTWLRGPGGMS